MRERESEKTTASPHAAPPHRDSPRLLDFRILPSEDPGEVEESLSPPREPIVVSLEELIEALRAKKAPKRWQFQITGRRLPPFVRPPQLSSVTQSPRLVFNAASTSPEPPLLEEGVES